MSDSEVNEVACEASEFADLLFQKFVLNREATFLEEAIENLPSGDLFLFKRRRFSLLVACVLLSFGFNRSAKSKVEVSVGQLKNAALNYAEKQWPGERFDTILHLELPRTTNASGRRVKKEDPRLNGPVIFCGMRGCPLQIP